MLSLSGKKYSNMGKTKQAKILIVDDDPEVLESVTSLVAGSGFSVTSCTTAKDALSLIQIEDFDSVLSDIQMRDISGIELLEKLKTINAEIPVILFTGHAEIDFAINAIKKGAFDFVTKPFNPAYLIESIKKAVKYHDLIIMEKNYTFKLEDDVKKKSAELEATIEILKSEIAERRKAEESLRKAKNEIELWNKELEKRVEDKTEELRKSQSQLVQSEKLSAMGEMAGGLAHELNSPLAGLLPMLEKYRDLSKKDAEEYKELSLMLKACNYMAKIVKAFVDFSGESKGVLTTLNINDVIEDTLSFSLSKFKKNGIQIVKEYAEDIPVIQGEKTELQQVILNMITNAGDALPDYGRLIIKTGSSEDRKSVFTAFIDNGPGIDEKNIDRIFDPFFTTKRPGDGIGLGLSVSYKIIEKHGGHIEAKSELGKGAKLTIFLPC